MYSIVNIFSGKPENNGHQSFNYELNSYRKVCGVLFTGGVSLSLAFDNGFKIIMSNYENYDSLSIPPNKRAIFFEQELKMKLVSGTIKINKKYNRRAETPGTGTIPTKTENDIISIYLLLK